MVKLVLCEIPGCCTYNYYSCIIGFSYYRDLLLCRCVLQLAPTLAYLILISVLRPSLLVRKSSNGYCWLSEGGGIYLVN